MFDNRVCKRLQQEGLVPSKLGVVRISLNIQRQVTSRAGSIPFPVCRRQPIENRSVVNLTRSAILIRPFSTASVRRKQVPFYDVPRTFSNSLRCWFADDFSRLRQDINTADVKNEHVESSVRNGGCGEPRKNGYATDYFRCWIQPSTRSGQVLDNFSDKSYGKTHVSTESVISWKNKPTRGMHHLTMRQFHLPAGELGTGHGNLASS